VVLVHGVNMVPQIPVSMLRTDLPPMAIGLLATVAGLIACALYFLRRRARVRLFLYFGLMAAMYGIRLFVSTPTSAYFIPLGVQRWVIWFVTGFILIPFVLFFGEMLAPEQWRQRRWGIAYLLVQGTAFVLAHFDARARGIAERVNNTVVLIALPVLILMLFLGKRVAARELWAIRIGVLALLCFTAYTNGVDLGFFHGSAGIEYIGFTIMLACLGYVTVRRAVSGAERFDVMHREMELAQEIQSRLLAGKVDMKGVEIATRYVPVAWVAGDFYDFLVRENGVGILVADVSGHGVSAALAASMVKIAIRSQMDDAGDPAAVLRGMNETLQGNMDPQYVTAAYLFVDTAERELRYSAAGHPPMLVWHAAAQQAEPVQENGLILGVFPDCEYTTRRMQLHPGDRCLLYTDGVSESPSPAGEEFGTERLLKFFRDNAKLPPEQFCDALLARIEAWSGRRAGVEGKEHPDDLTLVLMEFAG
jgi:sigma-B regulation protein RsbU (phosphoserine phosphatase)